jgi:hypothetical protein
MKKPLLMLQNIMNNTWPKWQKGKEQAKGQHKR